jgi:hypothetical protein
MISNRRGSTFYLCTLSHKDASFEKYPRQPVAVCKGYEGTDGEGGKRYEESVDSE